MVHFLTEIKPSSEYLSNSLWKDDRNYIKLQDLGKRQAVHKIEV